MGRAGIGPVSAVRNVGRLFARGKGGAERGKGPGSCREALPTEGGRQVLYPQYVQDIGLPVAHEEGGGAAQPVQQLCTFARAATPILRRGPACVTALLYISLLEGCHVCQGC